MMLWKQLLLCLKKRYKFIFFFLIFSCVINNNKVQIINYEIVDKSNEKIIFNVNFNIEPPLKLEENLKKFLYSEIILNIKIYDKDRVIGKVNIKKMIKFNRWEEEYSIFNLNKNILRKYNSFNELKKNINKFENIEISFFEKFSSNKLKVNCNYILKSVEFVPPFKFLEFYKNSGNINKNIVFDILFLSESVKE